MEFLDYWDTRIEVNKRLFDENPGIANFAYDECAVLFDLMAKEIDRLEKENQKLKICMYA